MSSAGKIAAFATTKESVRSAQSHLSPMQLGSVCHVVRELSTTHSAKNANHAHRTATNAKAPLFARNVLPRLCSTVEAVVAPVVSALVLTLPLKDASSVRLVVPHVRNKGVLLVRRRP